ncbi:MAG: hypothetical protein DME04_14905 [Candidatus Rokuibacteriota bacterium]|nr:MAG: hypothetical protein DME04_14905 [Candidatus Rokubacteria bacterium]
MRSRLAVGYLLPRILLVTLMIDGGLRFLPTRLFTFRPEMRYRLPGEAYERNAHTVNAVAYGDLAGLGNLRDFRQYRPDTMTTDGWGFRNLPYPGPFCAILIGDSFAIGGVGVGDRETLSARLQELWDCGVYNAAGATDPALQAPHAQRVASMARRLGLGKGLVLAEFVERLPTPTIPPLPPASADDESSPPPLARRLMTLGMGWASFSPGKILAQRVGSRLENDTVLPNRHARRVPRATLRDGHWMLFFDEEMETYTPERRVSAEYWIWLRRQLAEVDLELLVVLVPNKYTVYHDLLRDEPPQAVEPGESLTRLTAQLRDAGVPVVNVTSVLRAGAASAVAEGIHLYFQDDTHWNAHGIDVAARAVARAWREVLGP